MPCLCVSLLLNCASVGYAAWVVQGRGGVAYLAAMLHLTSAAPDPANENIVATEDAKFRAYAAPAVRPVVFLGDSLTAQVDWRELLGIEWPILNRGIGGDTSKGVLGRIGTITALRPKAVFLMIGTNDAQQLVYSPADSAAKWREIIRAIRREVPDCRIYGQSILPGRSPKFVRWGAELNNELRRLAQSEGFEYVDVRSSLEDSQGLLREEFSRDGLHLNIAGYQAWKKVVAPLVERQAAAGETVRAGVQPLNRAGESGRRPRAKPRQ